MRKNKGLYFFISALLALFISFKVLDSSPLFYCINITWVMLFLSILIFNSFNRLTCFFLKVKNLKKIIFLLFFIGIISIPIVQQLTKFATLEALNPKLNEKRNLVGFTPFKLGGLKSFPNEYTNFFNDNFGFRSFLISLNNYCKTIGFGISSNKDVIIGEKGWLFSDKNGSLKDHTGRLKLTEEELISIKKSLIEKNKYLKKRGIKYYVTFFPDKMSIYPENMPSKYNMVEDSRWSQLIKYMKNTDLNIIDLRPALNSNKYNNQLYQKTDTHWNTNGGYIAHKEIIKKIREDFTYVREPYKIESYEIDKKVINNGGDISNLLGVKPYMDRVVYNFKLKDDKEPKKRNMVPAYQFYNENYKATFGMKKNIVAPKLLTFNDSFISYIYPFLGDYFSECQMFWLHDFREDLIEKENPDIVITMFVERRIMKLLK